MRALAIDETVRARVAAIEHAKIALARAVRFAESAAHREQRLPRAHGLVRGLYGFALHFPRSFLHQTTRIGAKAFPSGR